ncbi:MAG TPA: hypothetical protein VGE85_05790 [Terracidiphilus sp.]
MKTNCSLIAALIVVGFTLLSDPAAAQVSASSETLSGRVVVCENNVPARGTQIWIFEAKGHEQYAVQQNSNGEFKISLPEGYYFVFIANLGMIPYAKEIRLEHGIPYKLAVCLKPDFEIMQDAPPR